MEDWSWVDSFYFSAVTLTTVGFGDLSPTTTVSKLFTVFYIFIGISLIGALLNEFLKRHARRASDRLPESKPSSDATRAELNPAGNGLTNRSLPAAGRP